MQNLLIILIRNLFLKLFLELLTRYRTQATAINLLQSTIEVDIQRSAQTIQVMASNFYKRLLETDPETAVFAAAMFH